MGAEIPIAADDGTGIQAQGMSQIHFIGTSHAAQHLKAAAWQRRIVVTENLKDADLVFVSEDVPTAEDGSRDLGHIIRLMYPAMEMHKNIVLTSQVPPGFTRSMWYHGKIWHQAETLRIKDATYRANHPDYIIVGGALERPASYNYYLQAFPCQKIYTDYESAEFSKIAINMTLAAQVENTNRLSAAAALCGADWGAVSKALAYDKRIGMESYLTPGRWQDSKHLLRDHYTLEKILAREKLFDGNREHMPDAGS